MGDVAILSRLNADSMRAWVDFVRDKAGDSFLWPEEFQLGDWLRSRTPRRISRGGPIPMRSLSPRLTSPGRPASSARAAKVLGRDDLAEEYGRLADQVRRAFREEFVTASHGPDQLGPRSPRMRPGNHVRPGYEDPAPPCSSGGAYCHALCGPRVHYFNGVCRDCACLAGAVFRRRSGDGVPPPDGEQVPLMALSDHDGSHDHVGALGQHAARRNDQHG